MIDRLLYFLGFRPRGMVFHHEGSYYEYYVAERVPFRMATINKQTKKVRYLV